MRLTSPILVILFRDSNDEVVSDWTRGVWLPRVDHGPREGYSLTLAEGEPRPLTEVQIWAVGGDTCAGLARNVPEIARIGPMAAADSCYTACAGGGPRCVSRKRPEHVLPDNGSSAAPR